MGACRRRQLLDTDQNRHRQQPAGREEPGHRRPPHRGYRGRRGQSPARPAALPPGRAAPAARFAHGRPRRCPRLGCKQLTASSWSGMPWEGMGHLHLSEERPLEQNGGVMLRSCRAEHSFGHFGVGDLEPGRRSQ
ncbi:uncharacterized protein LOC107054204 [Gallus gallus]|uniref:uncharacterized protein LOC107054204 n=1 Tax=Gallus gallus TaxID=9031 RepID=UPI001F003646|nr:uncharacterized protein LOC107054204 [Gallus gallus]XP_046781270.1 uncharacterized protein LOC107054204 [Gallus gallus]